MNTFYGLTKYMWQPEFLPINISLTCFSIEMLSNRAYLSLGASRMPDRGREYTFELQPNWNIGVLASGIFCVLVHNGFIIKQLGHILGRAEFCKLVEQIYFMYTSMVISVQVKCPTKVRELFHCQSSLMLKPLKIIPKGKREDEISFFP